MNRQEETVFSDKQLLDLKVVVEFVSLYCQNKHSARARLKTELPPELAILLAKDVALCNDCSDLLSYGIRKREKCPLDPKPACKNCHVHCYSGEYRAKIKEIMAYSGRKMVLRGRLDYLWHYFL